MAPPDELLALLNRAAEVAASCGELCVFCPFDTGAEFAAHLRALRERFANGDRTVLGELVGIFAPTGAWDDGIGEPMELANQIMDLLKELDWQHP